jgi:hypothetical protein
MADKIKDLKEGQIGHSRRPSCDQHHTAIDLHLSEGYDKLVSTTNERKRLCRH